MSKRAEGYQPTTCLFCEDVITEKHPNWRKVHIGCALNNGPDFYYTKGDFKIELVSTLVSPKMLRRIFNNLP